MRLIKTQILTIIPTCFFVAYRTPPGANDLDYSLKRHAGKTPNKNYLNIAKNNTVLMIEGQTPKGMLSFCWIQVTATLGAGWLMQTTTSCLRWVQIEEILPYCFHSWRIRVIVEESVLLVSFYENGQQVQFKELVPRINWWRQWLQVISKQQSDQQQPGVLRQSSDQQNQHRDQQNQHRDQQNNQHRKQNNDQQHDGSQAGSSHKDQHSGVKANSSNGDVRVLEGYTTTATNNKDIAPSVYSMANTKEGSSTYSKDLLDLCTSVTPPPASLPSTTAATTMVQVKALIIYLHQNRMVPEKVLPGIVTFKTTTRWSRLANLPRIRPNKVPFSNDHEFCFA